MTDVADFVSHLSDKPWSDYSESDYSIEQWHEACLIHTHDGPPTSKDQCKLPVKTPQGSVNKNAVHSATAALAGARSELKASSEQKTSAAKALIRYYGEMNEKPPASLLKHSDADMVAEFLEHHGVKGMKWGVRKSAPAVKTAKPRPAAGTAPTADFKKARELRVRHPATLTNKQLKTLNERIQLEQKHRQLNPTAIERGNNKVKQILIIAGTGVAVHQLLTSNAAKAAAKRGKEFVDVYKRTQLARTPIDLKTFKYVPTASAWPKR